MLIRSTPEFLGERDAQVLERIQGCLHQPRICTRALGSNYAIRLQRQVESILPYVCGVVSSHLIKLPRMFSTSLLEYLRSLRSATGQISFQQLEESFLLLSHSSQTRMLFTVLAKGRTILQADDFIPVIHSIVDLHESLHQACSTPLKLKRYTEFVQASVCLPGAEQTTAVLSHLQRVRR